MKGVYSVGISGLSGNCFHSRPKIPVGHQPITDFVGDSGSSGSKVTVGIASASDDRKVGTGLPSEGSPIREESVGLGISKELTCVGSSDIPGLSNPSPEKSVEGNSPWGVENLSENEFPSRFTPPGGQKTLSGDIFRGLRLSIGESSFRESLHIGTFP